MKGKHQVEPQRGAPAGRTGRSVLASRQHPVQLNVDAPGSLSASPGATIPNVPSRKWDLFHSQDRILWTCVDQNVVLFLTVVFLAVLSPSALESRHGVTDAAHLLPPSSLERLHGFLLFWGLSVGAFA